MLRVQRNEVKPQKGSGNFQHRDKPQEAGDGFQQADKKNSLSMEMAEDKTCESGVPEQRQEKRFLHGDG